MSTGMDIVYDMDIVYRDGYCLQGWIMPTGMDNAYRDGYCLQVWIMSTGIKIGHSDK